MEESPLRPIWPFLNLSGWSGVVNGLLLVCAVLASLAVGVLMAYGICLGMFRVFRRQSISAAKQRAAVRTQIA